MPDLTPWGATELSKLKGDMDRLFDALFEDFGLPPADRNGGVSVVPTGDGWRITCPLPGVEPEDVAVTLTGRVLSLEAVKRWEREGKLLVSKLSREWNLPFQVASASADLSGGTLTIVLKRQTPPKAQCVPVIKR
jgi:HSP20 family molecular chaperone IbpA